MSDFKKAEPVDGFTFALTNRFSGLPQETGICTGYYVLDDGVQAFLFHTPVHKGNGQWSVDIIAEEFNGKVCGLLFTHPDAVSIQFTIRLIEKLVEDLNDVQAEEIVSGGPIDTDDGGAIETVNAVLGQECTIPDGNWVSTGRITDILTRCRDSLSDLTKQRWSDDRLLRLIDEGQKDIVMKARLLRSKVEIAVRTDVNVYDIPEEAFQITRCIASDVPSTDGDTDIDRFILPVKTHSQMDMLDPGWETRVGNGIEYIIFDKLNPREIKIYPIPEDQDTVSEHTFLSSLGVLVESTGGDGAEDVISTDFGVVSDITTNAILTASFNSDFGVITDMDSILASLVVYYMKRPATVDGDGVLDVDILLEIDPIFDKALKHYVTGHAFRDDQDTQNKEMGNEEIGLYAIELEEAISQSSKDFTDGHDLNSDYRNGNLVYNTGFNDGLRKNNWQNR